MDETAAPGLRITLVIHGLGCGGAEKVMVNLAGRLAAAGYTVSLLTTGSTPDFFSPPATITRRRLSQAENPDCRWFDLPCQRRRTRALREALLRDRPDVVISFIDLMNIAVLLALAGSGVPVIVAEHSDPRRHPIGWRWSGLRRLLYPRASRVVLLTRDARDWALGLWPRWKAVAIPNGLEPTPSSSQADRPPIFGPLNLVAMGRLGPEKGFDLLIEAYARLSATFPDWHLIIYGEGQERPRLEAMIREKGLEARIQLPGIEQHPERTLPHADIFVVSSRYEGFSMVLAETMALGLPVVSFACSGPLEIVRDGVDGLLAPPGDVTALTNTLARVMKDEALRGRLAREARSVANRYAPERILELWRNEIEAVRTETLTLASS